MERQIHILLNQKIKLNYKKYIDKKYMIYDIIILGGGISGLYSAYKLLEKNKDLKILILEKNDYLGGRIKTFKKNINGNKFIFEEGAGRFNDNHKLLLQLIYELGLKDNIVKIPAVTKFYPSHRYETKFIGKSPFLYVNKVIKYSKNDSKELLLKYTFIEYAKQILPPDEIKFILDSFGYYKQLVSMNAYNAINLFKDGMNQNLQFYGLNCGLSTIIKNIKNKIKSYSGCKILLNHCVNNIEYNNDLFSFYLKNDFLYKSKKCILAIPKPDLLKFNILNSIQKELNSILYKSLCRIYAVFKEEDIWFKNISKTTTNNNSRYIIPLNKEKGSIMITYGDSKYADYWNSLSEKLLLENIKKNIYKTYKIKINDPIFLKRFYWKCGTGMWKKNKDSTILSKKIIQPFKSIPLYICGENYSETQGWIEGALETSENVIKKIFL